MNWIIGIVSGTALVMIVVALYCTLVIVGRSDKQANEKNIIGADKMFLKKQICPKCKVGKESYELDMHSDTCPYIGCWKDGKCQSYVPLESTSKKGVLCSFKDKQITTSRK